MVDIAVLKAFLLLDAVLAQNVILPIPNRGFSNNKCDSNTTSEVMMAERNVDLTAEMCSFLEKMDQAFLKAACCNSVITLVFIKLFHLDQIARSYGISTARHVFGDIKRLVCEDIRREDHGLICGSDELMVLLPNTPKDGARRVAAKLQRLVGSFVFIGGNGAQITLSSKVGVASCCYAVTHGTHRPGSRMNEAPSQN